MLLASSCHARPEPAYAQCGSKSGNSPSRSRSPRRGRHCGRICGRPDGGGAIGDQRLPDQHDGQKAPGRRERRLPCADRFASLPGTSSQARSGALSASCPAGFNIPTADRYSSSGKRTAAPSRSQRRPCRWWALPQGATAAPPKLKCNRAMRGKSPSALGLSRLVASGRVHRNG